jgi:hypothetical protein
VRTKVFGSIKFAIDTIERKFSSRRKFNGLAAAIRQIFNPAGMDRLSDVVWCAGFLIVSIGWLHCANRSKTVFKNQNAMKQDGKSLNVGSFFRNARIAIAERLRLAIKERGKR